MARKSLKSQPEPKGPIVASGDHLDVPPRRKVEAQPAVNVGRSPRPRRITARDAAARSTLFPAGGEAFAAWVATQGIDPTQRRDPEFWSDLLVSFAQRPIHGHRRKAGGNHKPNRADIRR